MKKHRLLFFLIITILFLQTIKCQNSLFKTEKRIYLWDVTLSMKGYNGAPNIWSEVVEALSKDINSIMDEETEIVVLPFQTSILEKWTQYATPEGKEILIKKIRQYNNESITNTNICTPFQTIMNEILDVNKRNILLLLTDGNHNTDGYLANGDYNINCLLNLVENWCSRARQYDAYAFYIMLTKLAKNNTLLNAIENTCRMSVSQGTGINFTELLLQDKCSFNIKDDKGNQTVLRVTHKKNTPLPENIKISIFSEPNDYVEVNDECTLSDGSIKFTIKPKKPYEELIKELPTDYNEKIQLYVNLNERNDHTNSLVKLISDEIELSLINKPEKTLRIYVQEKD